MRASKRAPAKQAKELVRGEWAIDSWRQYPVKQQPTYKDQKVLKTCLAKVKSLPPLVATNEIEALREALAECAQGKRFLLQGGDCAERFDDCGSKIIMNKLKILLQMSMIMTYGARIPTVRVGRLAGQFAKPRSKDTEIVGKSEKGSPVLS
jgi:3-deoxy-7-phosphoheptulonate synthase